MSEVKKAVIIGRIDLKPKQEIVVGPKQKGKPQVQERQPRRDRGEIKNSNTMMMSELQFQKGQVRKLQDEVATLRANMASLKTVMTLLNGDDSIAPIIKASDQFQEALKAVGLSK
jgi:hypothetical protein